MDLANFIHLALAEDIREGDHTSLACIPSEANSKAKLLVKEEGVLAGMPVAQSVFLAVDPQLRMECFLLDGTDIAVGDVAFHVFGSSQSILKAERLVLNLMQRMSGIATQTRRVMRQLEGLHTQVLDTRKTTPLLRFLEKEAVRIGGGQNHRMGLYDMIMIKDNHVDYAGGIRQAIETSNTYVAEHKLDLKIEIEVRNLNELDQVLAIGKVNRIMLDNFSFKDLSIAVKRIAGAFETEASGGITLENVREYALCGVDYVSMGSLTHSVSSLDLSLKAF